MPKCLRIKMKFAIAAAKRLGVNVGEQIFARKNVPVPPTVLRFSRKFSLADIFAFTVIKCLKHQNTTLYYSAFIARTMFNTGYYVEIKITRPLFIKTVYWYCT
jgi:hypothetical protein